MFEWICCGHRFSKLGRIIQASRNKNVQPVVEQIRGIIIQKRASESGMSESKRSNVDGVDGRRGKEIIDQGQCGV